MSGQLPDRVNLGFHAVFAVGCLFGLFMRRQRHQEVLGIGFAIAIVAYVAALFARLR